MIGFTVIIKITRVKSDDNIFQLKFNQSESQFLQFYRKLNTDLSVLIQFGRDLY